MQVEKFLEHLQSDPQYRRQIVHVETIPPRPAVRRAVPLPPPLEKALTDMGIEALYAHQAEAVEAVRRGENVVVATGTASGKSLCYNLPVLEGLIEQGEATALYLFPTKALAQDQLRSLLRFKELCEGLPLRAGTYDGDTPPNTRRTLREEGNCILTNPDMLHSGILPRHTSWGAFFENLRFVVIDEIHVYRGIFGSHVANVLRRLARIAAHYGARPVFIACSATIQNPKEHAEALIGAECTLVDQDGSPRGRRHFVFWNPPRIGETMERKSSTGEARELMVRLLCERVKTIAFTRARVVAELLYRSTREELQRRQPSLARAVRAYRGGYLPAERREIERALFQGELLGIASTNALELGVDVGGLDAAILVGYPGSIASTLQQAGRAGRGGQESVAFLVAHNAPLDQYLMQHPRYFFERSPERAVVDPDNPHVVLGHLRAAVFELPLAVSEERNFGPSAPALLDLLAEDGQIVLIGDRWYWRGQGKAYPADDVSLRSGTERTYTIVDTTGGKNEVIGSTDEISAFMQLHTEAVYLHNGETYFVSELDLVERVAYVHRADVDYYTQAITDQRIRIDEEQAQKVWRRSRMGFGDVSVTFVTFMFKKIRFDGRDSIGFGKVDLPPLPLETAGMWLVPPLDAFRAVREAGRSPSEGMLGLANVVAEVLPLFAMCDPSDIGAVVDSSNTGVPTLFLYDRYPGGVGFASKAYELIEEVLTACCELIHACECTGGCPSCVGAPIPPYVRGEADGDARGKVPDKEAALVILHALLEREPYIPKARPAPGVEAPQLQGAPVVRPRSEPLPERLELRLRKQMQRLKESQGGNRRAH